jgi:hypothetical protein
LAISKKSRHWRNAPEANRQPINQPLGKLHRLGANRRRGRYRSVRAKCGGNEGGGE